LVSFLTHHNILPVLVLKELEFSLECGVKVILYMIVGTAREQLSDLRPLISHVVV
jgi:hypothetical protein